jgi:DnaJ-class molecular chaperone
MTAMERSCALAILGLSEPFTKAALDARFRLLVKQLHPDAGLSQKTASLGAALLGAPSQTDAPLAESADAPTIDAVVAARNVLVEALREYHRDSCCRSGGCPKSCSENCSGGCSGSCSGGCGCGQGGETENNDARDGSGGAGSGLEIEIPTRIHLKLSAEMALRGGLFCASYPGGTCSECQGSGKAHPTTCLECLGDGVREVATGFIRVRVECAACGGTGHLATPPCPACRGRGNTEALRISVFVPRACENGELLEGTATPVSGKGKKVAGLPISVVAVLAA